VGTIPYRGYDVKPRKERSYNIFPHTEKYETNGKGMIGDSYSIKNLFNQKYQDGEADARRFKSKKHEKQSACIRKSAQRKGKESHLHGIHTKKRKLV